MARKVLALPTLFYGSRSIGFDNTFSKSICIANTLITSAQSNLKIRPHRRRTWTVQSYSLGCANVHPI